jgi:cation:H+ antiporter
VISAVLLLLGGVGILYFGAEWLVKGSVRLARAAGMSPIFVGLTVVSFGTSAPELVVAGLASFRGEGDLAVGNVLGSNLANIGLILGMTAIIRPMVVEAKIVVREIPIMIGITLLMYPLLQDLIVSRGDGLILLALLVGYLVFVARLARLEKAKVLGEYEKFTDLAVAEEDKRKPPIRRYVALVVIGCVALTFGGKAIVDAAVRLADLLGFSELEIGLTVVAVGTSLPELATSLVAAIRKEADIAVGNIIGSNVFNLTAIMGVAALIAPLGVEPTVMREEFPATVLLTVAFLPIARLDYSIRRWEGVFLLSVYLSIWFLVFQ